MASCSQTSPTRAFLLFVCGQGSRRHVPPRLASWTNSSRAIRSAVQCEVGVCPPTLKTCTPGTRESPRVLRLRSGASIFVHGFMACYYCCSKWCHAVRPRHRTLEPYSTDELHCFGRKDSITGVRARLSSCRLLTFWFPCCRYRARCTS